MQDSQGQGAPSRGENEGPRRAGDLAPQPKTGFNSGKATRALWGALNLGQQCDAELPIVLRGPNWIASRCAALARIEPHRPLHLTVLRCTASHHTALHRPALLCTVLRCSPPRCNLLPSTARTAQCCVALHFSAQCCAALHPLRCWHSSALTHTRCIAPRSTALLCAALPARTAVLPCTAVQKAHLHSTALPLRALHYAASLPCRMLHRIALHCVALRRVALHCIALDCVALRCVALHCVALRCVALHCVALRCTALHCTALRCAARTLHCTAARAFARPPSPSPHLLAPPAPPLREPRPIRAPVASAPPSPALPALLLAGAATNGAASMATRRKGSRRWPPSRAAGAPGLTGVTGRCSPLLPPRCCWAAAAPPAFLPPLPRPVSTAHPAARRWGRRGGSSGGPGGWGGQRSRVPRSRCWVRAEPCGVRPRAPPPGVVRGVAKGGGRARGGLCEEKGGKGLCVETGGKVLGPGSAGPCGCPGEPPNPAACSSPCQVVYQVPLKENRVLKRNVDQQLRIKIIYDRSVEE